MLPPSNKEKHVLKMAANPSSGKDKIKMAIKTKIEGNKNIFSLQLSALPGECYLGFCFSIKAYFPARHMDMCVYGKGNNPAFWSFNFHRSLFIFERNLLYYQVYISNRCLF